MRLSAGSGQVLTFSRVTGEAFCFPQPPKCGGGVTIDSIEGISGVLDSGNNMFLMGVFLTNAEPKDPAPARLDFGPSGRGENFASLAPKIDQSFFIGDGQTDAGAVQSFKVPAKATRLFLGFPDANFFNGPPGAYDTNGGSVRATFSIGAEPPPPVAGKSVVADVVSGVVLIKLPSGKRVRRANASQSPVAETSRFRRYRGKANIPVGSILDTKRGRVAITSAADLKGSTQTADFFAGIFQVKQARSAHPVTDAKLVTSTRACSARKAGTSKKRVLGRLWGTGKGRFRTRGRYSAAAVRGTTWLTEDRCDGTLTKVTRGTVAVRDFVKRKTIVLTAGQSYFARAQRASTKS